jgi:hypothetical protein
MLSKQVKQRIAINKTKHKVPGWKRDMRDFFISQLPPVQSVLSSKHFDVVITTLGENKHFDVVITTLGENKHFDVVITTLGEKVEMPQYQHQETTEIFRKIRTWTRQQWQAFIRSGDVSYSQYLARRQIFLIAAARRKILDIYGRPDDYKKMPAEIDQAREDHEKAVNELKKKQGE